MDRFNQMSGQADLIAKKKLEIEAKLKLQKEAAQNSGSVSVYNQLAGSSKNIPPVDTSSVNQRKKKALPIGNLKNRWGFKGKVGSESDRTSTAASSNETKNTFSNDGSFLEQFKKMQQRSETDYDTKSEYGSRKEYGDKSTNKQSSLSLGYTIKTNVDTQKGILSQPPPPPPSLSEIKDTGPQDSTNKPKEADEWYKQALERARNIAKNIGNSSNTAKETGNDVSPKAVSKSMIHSPHDQKQGLNCKIEPQPDFSVPPPPVLCTLMNKPPPSMSGGFSKNYVPANTIDSSNNSAAYDKDLNAGQYSPSKPTCTPTKNEANVAESLKAESKVLLADCNSPSIAGLHSNISAMYSTESLVSTQDLEDLKGIALSTVAEELASMVACSGDQLENIARNHNAGMDEKEMSFLYDPASKIYRKYRQRVQELREGMIMESDVRKKEAEENAIAEIAGTSDNNTNKDPKKRKRRWGDENDKVQLHAPVLLPTPGMLPSGSLKNVGRSNPELIQYAIRVFGTTDLTESQWKQCEDQIKMSMVYNEMLSKKKNAEKLAQMGKNKYEYDSDEDTEGGTWEHKARKLEMEKTKDKATEQTESGKGMHHIGDFLPPEELTKFMNKFKALQNGEEFDDSDYVENKLKSDNLGFKMLERMGWSEGKGLGQEGGGITAPIGKSGTGADKKGLGVSEVHNLEAGDDEFDAYRKRMMMAYRFRPNPLNNPRRAYY